MDEVEARAWVGRYHNAVLATIKRDGRPQLSNISYTLDDDGRIKISTTATRAKIRNLRRDPRVSLSVQTDNFHEYLVVEGRAEIQEGDVVPELRRIYVRIRGEPHPNWPEFDAAMIEQRRVVLAITIDRFYPLARRL
jgi:PPOX class probable F420-dependent enzyme